jgi:hypothetical protein
MGNTLTLGTQEDLVRNHGDNPNIKYEICVLTLTDISKNNVFLRFQAALAELSKIYFAKASTPPDSFCFFIRHKKLKRLYQIGRFPSNDSFLNVGQTESTFIRISNFLCHFRPPSFLIFLRLSFAEV